jgi:hypothetical protein
MQLDPMEFVRTLQVSVRGMLALARSLIHAMPKDAGAAVKLGATRIHERAVALQSDWIAHDQSPEKRDPRPVDQRVDAAFRALRDIAAGYADLEREIPQRAAAERVLTDLFPDGLAFTRRRYPEQWAEISKRLQKIGDDPAGALYAALELLGGAGMVAALAALHAEYGAAIGVTQPKTVVETPSLAEGLRALSDAISSYALKLLAARDLESDAEAEDARRALAPITELRATLRAKRAPAEPRAEEPIPRVG